VHICHPSLKRSISRKRKSKASSGQKHETLCRKITKSKKGAMGVIQVVECQASKCNALSSNPSAEKERERKIFMRIKG
jgi:hypothetical protein